MTWQPSELGFTFEALGYSAVYRLEEPHHGLQTLIEPRQLKTNLLGVRVAEPHRFRNEDCYGRKNDLIAVYPQTSIRPFNLHLQYRIIDASDADQLLTPPSGIHSHGEFQDAVIIELWVSNYTFSLETYPQIDIAAFPIRTDSVEALQLWQECEGGLEPIASSDASDADIAAICCQENQASSAMSLFIHPMDQLDTNFTLDQGEHEFAVVILKLLDRFMEKGVIRRWRCRLVLTGEVLSASQLQFLYQQFADSPLPLTT